MNDINTVSLSGRLTRTPELRYTNGGTPILEIPLAFTTSRKNQSGEWEEQANFIDCTLIGKRAEAISPKLDKGVMVFVSGHLAYRSWEKDGQKRSKVSITADSIVIAPRGEAKQQRPAAPEVEMYDEDIPF